MILSKKATVARIYLPPDANCLLSRRRSLLAQQELRESRSSSTSSRSSSGSISTPPRALHDEARRSGSGLATTKAMSPTSCWLRRRHPDARDGGGGGLASRAGAGAACARRQRRRPDDAVRSEHASRTGWTRCRFVELFTSDRPSSSPSTATQRAIHELLHGRPNAVPLPRARVHRGGHDDDPVRHGRARTRRAASILRSRLSAAHRLPPGRSQPLIDECEEMLERHGRYIREHLDDMPEITSWSRSEATEPA